MQFVVNKTKLFRIITGHVVFVPKMKLTHFSKASDDLNYYLEWSTERGYEYHACLSFESSHPELMINRHDKQAEETRTIIKVRWNNVNEFLAQL